MIAFATDEDIALRASSDFLALCPRDQTLASGGDGVFSPDDRWTLVSPSVDFAGAGLRPGQVVELSRPSAAFGPGGESFAIQAVTPIGVVLRRKGQAPGIGRPPAPLAGLAGVLFAVRTLGPQIERAGDDLGRRLGIDDQVSGRRRIDLCDPTEIREAVVLTVLYRQFLDQSLQFVGPEGRPDDRYAAKAKLIKAELDDHLAGLAIRWATAPGGAGFEAVRLAMRVGR